MEAEVNNPWKKTLVVLHSILLSVGTFGTLLMRLYFIKGGKRIWFTSWLQTGGWPVILIPLLNAYFSRKKAEGSSTKFITMNHRVFIAAAVIGVLTGSDNYLSTYGVARLPVSTSTLILASQLAFTAFFAFIFVKQKFTTYSINAIFLVIAGSVVLALHSSADRPEGESKRLYILGFIMTVGAAALYGLILPMLELMYQKAKQAITYTLLLEIQLVLCFFATGFCTVAMLIDRDFQAIPQEARAYELGEARYYLVIVGTALIWQCFYLGTIGVTFYASALFSGILMAILLPVTEILAVIFYHEKFTAEKGVSLVLSLWGFISYFYGEKKQSMKSQSQSQSQEKNEVLETEMTPTIEP